MRRSLAKASPRAARALLCTVALVVLALLATGCGEGSDKTGASASVTTTVASQSPPVARSSTVGQAPAPATTASVPAASSAVKAPSSDKASGAIAKADAICARRDSELGATPALGSSARPEKGTLSKRAAIERRALAELARIAPPEAVAGAYRRVLAANRLALRRTLADVKRDGSASASHPGQLGLMVTAIRAGLKHCYYVQ